MTKTRARLLRTDSTAEDEIREYELRQKILREYRREKLYEKIFCSALMFWSVAVIAWHTGPYVIDSKNWPDMLLFCWVCLQFFGLMAALLGGCLLFAWFCTLGRIFDDDFYT
jgi:hypothetical protein